MSNEITDRLIEQLDMSRLSWFPFYVSDWLGGTASMLPSEKGSYLSALLAQWQSGDLKAMSLANRPEGGDR